MNITAFKSFLQTKTFHIICLMLLTFMVYSNTFKNEFVWDDTQLIVKNTFIKDIHNLKHVFSKDYFTYSGQEAWVHSGRESFRPVTTTSYFIDYYIWANNASGYHLTNLILYMLAVILAYKIAFLLFSCWKSALMTALLFSLHPINTEVVNAICFRGDILAFIFVLLSFLFYIKAKNKGYILLSCLFFMLALSSKESVIIMPLVFIVYSKLYEKNNLKYKALSYVLISSLFLVARIFILHAPGTSFISKIDYSSTMSFNIMSLMLKEYLRLLIIPLSLSTEHPLSSNFSILDIATFIITGIILIATFHNKNNKPLTMGVIWIFAALIPVVNPLVNVVAERYLFLASFGFCLILVSAIKPFLLKSRTKYLVLFICSLLCIIYGMRTFERNYDWKDDKTLWSKTIIDNPYNALGYYSLGCVFLSEGKYSNAENYYKKCIEINPAHEKAYCNLGLIEYYNNRLHNAEKYFKKSLEINPNLKEALYNMSLVLKKQKKHEESIK